MKKYFLLAAVITLLFAGSVGMPGMSMNVEGQMSNCPFMGVTVVCTMSPLEHMAAWQNMFAALPLKDMAALASLLILAVFTAFFLRDVWDTSQLHLVAAHRQRFRRRTYSVRSELQDAFSNGILHPKVF